MVLLRAHAVGIACSISGTTEKREGGARVGVVGGDLGETGVAG
jgi:hypothetical protein